MCLILASSLQTLFPYSSLFPYFLYVSNQSLLVFNFLIFATTSNTLQDWSYCEYFTEKYCMASLHECVSYKASSNDQKCFTMEGNHAFLVKQPSNKKICCIKAHLLYLIYFIGASNFGFVTCLIVGVHPSVACGNT